MFMDGYASQLQAILARTINPNNFGVSYVESAHEVIYENTRLEKMQQTKEMVRVVHFGMVSAANRKEYANVKAVIDKVANPESAKFYLKHVAGDQDTMDKILEQVAAYITKLPVAQRENINEALPDMIQYAKTRDVYWAQNLQTIQGCVQSNLATKPVKASIEEISSGQGFDSKNSGKIVDLVNDRTHSNKRLREPERSSLGLQSSESGVNAGAMVRGSSSKMQIEAMKEKLTNTAQGKQMVAVLKSALGINDIVDRLDSHQAFQMTMANTLAKTTKILQGITGNKKRKVQNESEEDSEQEVESESDEDSKASCSTKLTIDDLDVYTHLSQQTKKGLVRDFKAGDLTLQGLHKNAQKANIAAKKRAEKKAATTGKTGKEKSASSDDDSTPPSASKNTTHKPPTAAAGKEADKKAAAAAVKEAEKKDDSKPSPTAAAPEKEAAAPPAAAAAPEGKTTVNLYYRQDPQPPQTMGVPSGMLFGKEYPSQEDDEAAWYQQDLFGPENTHSYTPTKA